MNTDKEMGILRGILLMAIALIAGLVVSSCVTTGGSSGGTARTLPPQKMNSEPVMRRNQVIALETPGDYYIGRRWFTEGTRYWGYIRKPRQPWSEAKLVVMNETVRPQPDRVPEVPADGGMAHGFDHNYEYKLWGAYTGLRIYDPNSNLELPEFRLSRYELISANPGFLFYPGEPYESRKLPPKHPPTP